ncbi:MAG: hypothetical protein ACI8ZM_000266 [Crocinitomix sp.]|jgi:hypothetical protein
MTESDMNAYYQETMVGASDDYKSDYSLDDVDYETTGNSVAQNTNAENNGLTDQMVLDRKLIKNASLNFETDSLTARKKIVNKAVKEFNAYVEHEEQYASHYQETVTTTIRVPAANFDPFMDAITAGVGRFDSKTIEVDDVTEEYVDVEARINTKKELKIRFIALLDKAETIAKIMEVEREITALQAEIESYEGRLKYLSGSVKYATINLTYYRTIEVPVEFDNKFESAFSNGWQATVWFFVGLVSIWPMLVLIAVILLIIKLKLRKQKAKSAQ